MILVRDVFRLKFGKARDVMAVWKDIAALMKRVQPQSPPPRILTDLVGPYYTFVMETTANDLASWETTMRTGMNEPEFRTLYQKFSALVDSGYREIFTVVDM